MIYVFRDKYIKNLSKYAREVLDEMSSGREVLELKYKGFAEENENISLLAETMLNKLIAGREKDIKLGYTGTGPHKDDVDIFINGLPAKAFGSQGQQRSCVMAMKLAEAQILKDAWDEYPVLLFDDVFSELDRNRKSYIIEKIKNKQVIITAGEKIEEFGNAKMFEISEGRIL